MESRMREICTSGSTRGVGGNLHFYSTVDLWLPAFFRMNLKQIAHAIQWLRRCSSRGMALSKKELAEYFEVHPKTIQRLIGDLGHLGLQVRWDRSLQGYQLGGEFSATMDLQIDEKELFSLGVLGGILDRFKGTDIHPTLLKLFHRLERSYRRSDLLEDFNPAFLFVDGPSAQVDQQLWSQLAKAVFYGYSLKIEYSTWISSEHQSTRLDPYFMAHADNKWYVVGWSHRRKAIRSYAVARIHRVIAYEHEAFVRPKDLDAKQLTSESLGVFWHADQFLVRFSFSLDAEARVRERNWHHRQEISIENNRVQLRFPANSLFAVQELALSWGRHLKVEEPLELARRVKAELTAASALYTALEAEPPPLPKKSN